MDGGDPPRKAELAMIDTQNFQEVAARFSRTLGAATADTLDIAVMASLEEFGAFAGVDIAFATLVDDDECIADDWHWIRPGCTVSAPAIGSPLRDTFASVVELLRLGNTIAVDDVDEIELAPSERRLASVNELRAIVLVPVRVGTSLLGVAGLQVLGRPRSWNRAEIGQAEVVGELLVQAVSRTRERGARAAADARARRIAEFIPDGLLLLGTDGVVTWASPSFLQAAGLAGDDATGRAIAELVHPDDGAALANAIADARCGRAVALTARVQGSDGWRWNDLSCLLASEPGSGVADELVVSLRDTHDRHLATEQLAAASERDTLTGVLNRAGLDRLLDELGRQGARLAIAFCDIDGFKAFNDRLGHAMGDEVLRLVAQALVAAVRPRDVVARLGGDEFAVLVLDDDGGSSLLGERLVTAVRAHTATDGPAVTVSVGVSATGSATSSTELLRSADAAMYHAKRAGKDRWASAAGPAPDAPGAARGH
jgi:diguanylate cyclase (GGDEF)-like protein/PAS domain S-box-containing protein